MRVLASNDRPISGVHVTFTVDNEGSVANPLAITDADGIASVGSWTLGVRSGPNTVVAAASGLTPVQFVAHGTPGPLDGLELQLAEFGQLGSPLHPLPSAKARDSYGNGVEGVSVEFSVSGGSLTLSSVPTNSSGLASTSWVMPTVAGSYTLMAQVPGTALQTQGVVTLTAQGAALVHLTSGMEQSAEIGTELEHPLVVRITDTFSNPVAGVEVAFLVTQGGGSVEHPLATTDSDGFASAGRWALGLHLGTQVVTVVLDSEPKGAFTATGLTGPADAIEFEGGSPTGVVGKFLQVTGGVRVRDRHGHPLTFVPLSVAVSAGSLSATSSSTDASGLATLSAWELGTVAGPQSLHVTVVGTNITASRTVTAVADVPKHLTHVSGNSQAALIGATLPSQVVLGVRDLYGNPAIGATVAFSVTSGGGSLDPELAIVDENGDARTTWTLGSMPGHQHLSAVVNGTDLELSVLAIAQPAPLTGVATIDVHDNHACALKTDGSISCWGAEDFGQLGRLTSGWFAAPVDGSATYKLTTTGVQFSCALTTAGLASCWGVNHLGQLGDGTNSSRHVPAPVSGGPSYSQLVSGNLHSCALEAGGQAWCWGYNAAAQIDSIDQLQFQTPHQLPHGAYAAITAGGFHTCALDFDGKAHCWGRALDGQLGNGSTMAAPGPHEVVGDLTFKQIVAGRRSTCGLLLDGQAFCWGANDVGQIGDGTYTPRSEPTAVATSLRFDSIAMKDDNACGVASGDAYCWGPNSTGQLGTGTFSSSANTPQQVTRPTGVLWRSVHPSLMTCGVTIAGEVYCWGGNTGLLGDGVTQASAIPVQVRGN